MERSQLEELWQKELEKANNIKNKIKKDKISCKLFYPEFSDIKPPYTYRPHGIKVTEIISFNKTLIVNIRPIKKPQSFKEEYGLSVNDLIWLYEKRRVVFRVSKPHYSYANLDYLDPILELSPPYAGRHRLLRIFPNTYEKWCREIWEVLGSYSSDQELLTSKVLQMLYGKDLHPLSSFKEALQRYYAELCYFLGPNYTRELVKSALSGTISQISQLDAAILSLRSYSYFLIWPHTCCLDGINTVPSDTLKFLRKAGLLPVEKLKVFPYEIGRALIDHFRLNMPQDLDLAIEISPKKWFIALNELERLIESRELDRVGDSVQNIKNVLRELNEEIRAIKRRKQRLNEASILLGVTGVLMGLIRGPGIIQSLLSIASPIIPQIFDEIVLRFTKPNHILILYEIQRELDTYRK